MKFFNEKNLKLCTMSKFMHIITIIFGKKTSNYDTATDSTFKCKILYLFGVEYIVLICRTRKGLELE